MREFTKNDWYGLCGAEPTEDGRQPMINETDNNLCAQLTVDKTGIQILGTISDEEGTELRDWAFYFECTYDMGLIIAERLEKAIIPIKTLKELESLLFPLGFEKILG